VEAKARQNAVLRFSRARIALSLPSRLASETPIATRDKPPLRIAGPEATRAEAHFAGAPSPTSLKARYPGFSPAFP
jgi:hypothetical protein